MSHTSEKRRAKRPRVSSDATPSHQSAFVLITVGDAPSPFPRLLLGLRRGTTPDPHPFGGKAKTRDRSELSTLRREIHEETGGIPLSGVLISRLTEQPQFTFVTSETSRSSVRIVNVSESWAADFVKQFEAAERKGEKTIVGVKAVPFEELGKNNFARILWTFYETKVMTVEEKGGDAESASADDQKPNALA
mgnify:CR=1 FL=1